MVISIDYNEPNPRSYKNVKVYYSPEKESIFESGDFCKDWFLATKEALLHSVFSKDDPHVLFSSSVDHFFMDGADELYDVINIPDTTIQIYIPKGSKMNWEKCKKLWND